jgi:hypothetical protein
MKRRDLFALIASTAALRPLAGAAQQPKMPTIGVLVAGIPAFRKCFPPRSARTWVHRGT